MGVIRLNSRYSASILSRIVGFTDLIITLQTFRTADNNNRPYGRRTEPLPRAWRGLGLMGSSWANGREHA